ncbi:hypothetical protein EAI_02070 [Harpegnathos saltator]|uniref:Uncharacterized protein n=1 Tax=Harpegnathos saltator TaxID=610380 RepID=E2BCR0_HARSA|nr:hypothetical protein EAI_02070 [Harpegnathos saltator]
MHHRRTRVCIYVGHMVVSTVLRPPWVKRALLRLLGTGFYPLATTATPLPKSPHEFSMRLAAHLCRDRPHRHHRLWTKLVNLLTARTGTSNEGCFGFGSMLAHMEPAERICCDNAANDLSWTFVMLNCGSIRTP